MCPLPQSDGHDDPRLVDESVPGIAAVVEDILVGREDTVREPVVPHELPDVLNRVELGAFGRQRDDGDVLRDDKPMRQVPSRLVDEKHGMSPWCDSLSDLRQMQGHRCGIAPWQDERSTFALSWADGTEDVGRSGPLIRGRRWSCAAPGPATGDLVLLPDPGFVSEPDLYRGGSTRFSCAISASEDCRRLDGVADQRREQRPCAWLLGCTPSPASTIRPP
jgi:hypothetical protein